MRLLVLDPSPIFRRGLKSVLAEASGADVITVVGECADLATAAQLVESVAPDVVVSDFHVGDQTGIDVVRELARIGPLVRVLILASHGPEFVVHQALSAGATGYVLKGETAEVVVSAIRSVGEGKVVLPPGVSEPRRRRGRKDEEVVNALDPLSVREREVFALAVWGRSNKQIAEGLNISVKTVETHRGHINRKLRVRSTADMVRLASALGMLEPAPVPLEYTAGNGVRPQ